MKHILIIEDNATAASIFRATLSRAGFTVATAKDGESGLEAIERARPDLVVLDLMLPGIGGLETLRRIRANPALADVPVIVASNAYTTDRLDDIWNAGATQVLAKVNMTPKELARVVTESLATRPTG